MNILIFSWRGPKHPREGGAEIVTHEYAKGWVMNGHTVTLFTSKVDGILNEEIIDGIKVIRKGKEVFGVHIAAFFWYLFETREKFDLIIDQFHGIPFFTPLYVKAKKLAFIHEVANEVWALNPWPKPFNLLPQVIGRVLEPWIFKLAYKRIPFLTVSPSTKKELTQLGIPKDKITVINNGIEIPKNVKGSKGQVKTITYLGAITRDKGIEDAIRAFSEMAKVDNVYQFLVIGKGEIRYVDYIKRLSGNLGLKGKIMFYGFVTNQHKFELLKRSHILINPSIREGWGLVIIEAASMGTPTVCYDVPGLRDSVIDNKTGILCEFGEYKCLAGQSINLLKDKKKYDLLSQGAILWSRQFSWGKSVAESLKLLDELDVKSGSGNRA